MHFCEDKNQSIIFNVHGSIKAVQYICVIAGKMRASANISPSEYPLQ